MSGEVGVRRILVVLIIWSAAAAVAAILFAPQVALVPGCYGTMVPPRPSDSPACLAAQPANLQPAAGAVIVIGYLIIATVVAILAIRSARRTGVLGER
jgi:hypothetical protein